MIDIDIVSANGDSDSVFKKVTLDITASTSAVVEVAAPSVSVTSI